MLPFMVKHWQPIKRATFIKIFIATVIGLVANLLFLYAGLKRTSGSSAALLITLGPILLFMLSIEVLKEKLSPKILFGLIISALGALVIVITPTLGNTTNSPALVGNIFILLAVVCDVLGTIIIKPVLDEIKPGLITALRLIIATSFFVLIAIPDFRSFSFTQLTGGAIGAIGYGALISLVGGLLLYHYGLSKITVESSTVLHYLTPVFGVITSIVILGEQLTTTVVVGAGLIFWGIYIAEARLHTKLSILHHQRH
jgi:drug/metabolite transporter (DMT)-like permease